MQRKPKLLRRLEEENIRYQITEVYIPSTDMMITKMYCGRASKMWRCGWPPKPVDELIKEIRMTELREGRKV